MSYTRFVIIGQERTGSNFLQLLLASHRSALSYGEIFNAAEEVRKTFRAIARPPAHDEDPISYLESQIYKEISVGLVKIVADNCNSGSGCRLARKE